MVSSQEYLEAFRSNDTTNGGGDILAGADSLAESAAIEETGPRRNLRQKRIEITVLLSTALSQRFHAVDGNTNTD